MEYALLKLRKLLLPVLLVIASVGGFVITDTGVAGAATVVNDWRDQFVGDYNAFYDIHYTWYDNGVINTSVDLYSNSPRVYQGRVADFTTYDYAFPEFTLYNQGGDYIGVINYYVNNTTRYWSPSTLISQLMWNVPSTVGRWYGIWNGSIRTGPDGGIWIYDSRVRMITSPNWQVNNVSLSID